MKEHIKEELSNSLKESEDEDKLGLDENVKNSKEPE